MTEAEFKALKPGDVVIDDRDKDKTEYTVTEAHPACLVVSWVDEGGEEHRGGVYPIGAARHVRRVAKQHGGHYAELGQYETVKVIEAWQSGWPPEWRYWLGSALKYISRLGRKPGASPESDLKKAHHFLSMLVENIDRKLTTGD